MQYSQMILFDTALILIHEALQPAARYCARNPRLRDPKA